MSNVVMLVGRLVENPELKDDKECIITIEVPRSFKDEDGNFSKDIIDVKLWLGIAEKTMEFCHKGDLVGIKGRIETNDNKIEIIAEKITFLTAKKEE